MSKLELQAVSKAFETGKVLDRISLALDEGDGPTLDFSGAEIPLKVRAAIGGRETVVIGVRPPPSPRPRSRSLSP